MILAGDVGGTKCTFTLFTRADSGLHPGFRLSLPTKSAATFEAVLAQFRSEAVRQGHNLNQLKAAAFGVAGAVVGDRVLSSNLPWPVERKSIAAALNLATEKVLLLNDLVAAAASLAHLNNDDLLKLNDGTREPRAPMALIAAGTGLGEAILFWDGQRYQISPSEASLTDFAPRNDREFLLLQSLRHRMPRVVTEEVVSGRGFRAIHQIIFPGVQHAFFDEPGVDAAAMITQQALTGSCTACAETLQIWTEAYGAEAGNMALRVLPFGGVYVAGGIALKILPKLKEGGFVQAFSDKMKLSTALAKIPIYVILNEDAPVIGAAYEAAAISGASPL
jgi:glucokinase